MNLINDKLFPRFAAFFILTIVLALSLQITACSTTEIKTLTTTPKECTLIGCEDSLSITINGNIPDKYMIRLVDSKGAKTEIICSAGQIYSQSSTSYESSCEEWGIALFNYSPDVLDLTISWDEESFSKRVQPNYEDYYPNGQDCPVGCRTGSVSIKID